MVDLLPASLEDAESKAKLFEAIAPVNCRRDGWLHRAVVVKQLTVEQVAYNGQPAFLLWWHKSIDDGLWISACQSYDNDIPPQVAFLGIAKLRTREKCGYVRFMTIRAGLAHLAKKMGYQAEGVMLFHP